MPVMNFSTPILTTSERVGLVWISQHRGEYPPYDKVNHRTRYHLLQNRLIEFDPKRKPMDPVTYWLTEAGFRALDPLS